MAIRVLPISALLLVALIGLGLGASADVLTGPFEPSGGYPSYVTGRRALQGTCTENNCGLIGGCATGEKNCCCGDGGQAWVTQSGCKYCCGSGKVGCRDASTDHACYYAACPGSVVVDQASAAGKTVTDAASSGLDSISSTLKTIGK